MKSGCSVTGSISRIRARPRNPRQLRLNRGARLWQGSTARCHTHGQRELPVVLLRDLRSRPEQPEQSLDRRPVRPSRVRWGDHSHQQAHSTSRPSACSSKARPAAHCRGRAVEGVKILHVVVSTSRPAPVEVSLSVGQPRSGAVVNLKPRRLTHRPAPPHCSGRPGSRSAGGLSTRARPHSEPLSAPHSVSSASGTLTLFPETISASWAATAPSWTTSASTTSKMVSL